MELWTMDYGCNVSGHVGWLHEVKDGIISSGDPHQGTVGIFGSHSAWSWLLDPEGNQFTID